MTFQASQNEINKLFPAPVSLQSSKLPIPRPLPGVTPASTATLKEVLQDNHRRWHCYFNDKGFHNHIAHTTLALWYLGADSDTIKSAYACHSKHQRPAFASPGPVNKENWTKYLGNEKYYDAYVSFFAAELEAKGLDGVLGEYIFSIEANFPGGPDEKQAEMLNRFTDGLVHPLIHVGYGAEFNLPGMAAQGLSQAATHAGATSAVITASWFKDFKDAKNPKSTASVLNVLARVLADPEISGVSEAIFSVAIKKQGQNLAKHVEAWSPDLSTPEGLEKSLEEFVWFAVLIYAVPGLTSKEDGLFNADFFFMHFVTSSLFLSSLLAHLKPKSQELLLRAYLVVCLTWFITRGKPSIDLKTFFQNDATLKSLIPAEPLSGPSLPLPEASRISPNPWAEIIQRTLVHPDDHYSKLQRALVHYAQVYGERKAGCMKNSELEGAEVINGTLFIRAANLTAYRMNRHVEDGFRGFWDRRGFHQEKN